jgi:hypothetical protein
MASPSILQPWLPVSSTYYHEERFKEWAFVLEPRMLTPNEIERIIVRLENYQQALSSECNLYHSLYSRALQTFIDAIRRHARHGVFLKTTLRRPLLRLCLVGLRNTPTPNLSKVNKGRTTNLQLLSSFIALKQIKVETRDGSIHEHVPSVLGQLYVFLYVAFSKPRFTKSSPEPSANLFCPYLKTGIQVCFDSRARTLNEKMLHFQIRFQVFAAVYRNFGSSTHGTMWPHTRRIWSAAARVTLIYTSKKNLVVTPISLSATSGTHTFRVPVSLSPASCSCSSL